ncbi:MAG: cytochrome c3 family protein [Planctomycetota bacterium]|jgi:nitrate/TMAO reductase-like tetraheme cytochrome c subunit
MAGKLSRLIGWCWRLFKRWGPAFISGIGFALICFLSINALMKPFSTSEYCGTACHEMNETYRTWELSHHAANADGVRAECIDCHLPPKEEYFTHLTAKAWAGGKDMYMHYFGPEYDIEKIRQKVLGHFKNETCMYCHDNLLIKPSSPKSRLAHLASIQEPEKEENKCVTCHEDAGHVRDRKLYAP